jgi:GntR family transcriptional repressor for pyruvate dehydrogenase complex
MALRAVKRKRIHEDIVAQIRRHVVDGRLQPGDRLPSERVLSVRFRVSRASVREAIRALESMGLVQILSGDGTYIASGLDVLLGAWRSSTPQKKDALRDAFEARKIIEPKIAALAASRATEAEIRRMEATLAQQAREVADGQTGVESDSAFHSLLAYSTKNHLLLKLNESIVDGLRETRERSLHAPGRPSRSLAGHRTILDAVRARDPGRAQMAMLRHLQQIERNVLSVGHARKPKTRGGTPQADEAGGVSRRPDNLGREAHHDGIDRGRLSRHFPEAPRTADHPRNRAGGEAGGQGRDLLRPVR